VTARPHPLLLDLAAGRDLASGHVQDPERLVRSAFEHRMGGLLWSRVEGEELDLPPEQAMLLASRDMAVEQHHARLWRTLHDVQGRLSRLGLETAVVKGVPAEARWFRRMGERPCSDIDLLLESGSEGRLGDVLNELDPGHPQREEVIQLFGSGMLQSVDLSVDGVAIDLHADVLKIEIATRGADDVWARTQMVATSSGTPVRTIDAETSLILFAVHLNKDRFARLLGYADLARILGQEPLDWAFIERFLGREGLRVPVYSTLSAVTETLSLAATPVPVPRGWRAMAWARLWPVDRRLQGYVSLGTQQHRQLWIPWLAEGRMGEALLWWIRRRVLPPGSLLRVYDPDLRGPYPVRWVVGRYRAWRKRRDDERTARRATAVSASGTRRRSPIDARR
jgi:hypothetical protein